jgi:hypothetical protein
MYEVQQTREEGTDGWEFAVDVHRVSESLGDFSGIGLGISPE